MLFPEIEQTQVIKIFYCYAREDKALRDELDKQLAPLKRLGLVATWHDREIIPGVEWKREIDTRLNVADIILLLISAHFIHSDYCYSVEMRRALERHKAGDAHVIPVILRPVEWKETPLGDLQALPLEGKPITKWRHRDDAFQTVAQGIRDVIEALRKKSIEPLFTSYTHVDAHLILPRERTVEEVYSKLTQSNITALALTGIAGIGKSTLADLIANYAEKLRYAGKGPFQAQPLWIRIERAASFVSVAEKIFDALGKRVPDFQHSSPQDQVFTLFHALNTTKSRLIILDQFEHFLNWQTEQNLLPSSEVNGWLEMLNRNSCACRVLFTSRAFPLNLSHHVSLFLQEYVVPNLEVAEGVEMLRKQGVSLGQETDDALQKAVIHTNGHALALTILASLLAMNQSLKIDFLFGNTIYSTLWEESIGTQELLNVLYNQQIDETQRVLLGAFSLYREPVPLKAATILLKKISEKRILLALNSLLRQHLLQASGEGHYQLHSIISTYAQNHFGKEGAHTSKRSLQAAHQKAAEYYLHRAIVCPPRDKRQRVSDIQPFIEATWHLCQAKRWQEAYTLMEREDLFTELHRKGGNTTLLELYQLMQPLEKWNQGHSSAIRRIYSSLGRVYQVLGQPEQARECFERLLHACTSAADKGGQGEALRHLAQVYDDWGDKEEAGRYYEQALQVYREIEDYTEEAKCLRDLGWIYAGFLRNKERASEYLEKALQIFIEVGNSEEEAWSLSKLSFVYDEWGDKDRGQMYAERALKLFKKNKEPRGEAWKMAHLGKLYSEKNQVKQAKILLEQGLTLFRKVNDRRGEAWVLFRLGEMYLRSDQYEQALHHYKQALSVFKEVGERIGEGVALNYLGLAYYRLGQAQKASKSYEQALEILRDVNDRLGEGQALLHIGLFYAEAHRNDVALAALLLAREIFKNMQSPEYDKAQRKIDALNEEIGEQAFSTLLDIVESQELMIVEQALATDNTELYS